MFALYMIINYVRIINDNKVTTFGRFPFTYHDISVDKRADVNISTKEQVIDKQLKDKILCYACFVYRPERSSHYKKCMRCFLKRISHSYLMQTCIGFHNQKFYILFIISLTIHNILIFVVSLRLFFLDFSSSFQLMTNIDARFIFRTYILAMTLISFIEIAFIIYSLIFHLYLILRNETNLERKALKLYRANDSSLDYVFTNGLIILNTHYMSRNVANPYYLGIRKVFGDNYWEWILPNF